METVQYIMYGVLPIVGVVIGATLQYLFSRFSEKEKHEQNLRTQAYVDFLRGFVGVAIAQRRKDNDKEQEYTILVVDAKARIAVYGRKEVIEAIANFWRAGANIDTPERRKLFTNICQAMGKESLPLDQQVLNKEVSQLLFSEDIE